MAGSEPVELEAELRVAVHDHAADGAAVGVRLGHDLQERVDAGVQAAAAGVRLHAGTVDAELLAEAVQRRLGRGDPGAIGREEAAPLRLQHVARTRHAGLRQQRRRKPVLRRLAGMEALGHGAVGQECPDAAGEGAGDAERVGEAGRDRA